MASRKRSKIARSEAKPSGENKLDGGVFAASAILATLGIVMIYSTTAPLAMSSSVPPHLLRHLVALIGGLLCAALATRLVPRLVHRRMVQRMLVRIEHPELRDRVQEEFLGHE
ncbi:MAG: hypothetical protein ABFS30_09740, partial [Pseudomonadota bacterium]